MYSLLHFVDDDIQVDEV